MSTSNAIRKMRRTSGNCRRRRRRSPRRKTRAIKTSTSTITTNSSRSESTIPRLRLRPRGRAPGSRRLSVSANIQKGASVKSLKILLASAALLVVVGLAYVAQQTGSGTNMVAAATGFVSSLTPEQKKQAIFDYDSDERLNWPFIPLQDKEPRKY